MVQCKLVSKLLHERRRKNLFKSTTHDFSNCDECFAYEHLTEKSTKLTKNGKCRMPSTINGTSKNWNVCRAKWKGGKRLISRKWVRNIITFARVSVTTVFARLFANAIAYNANVLPTSNIFLRLHLAVSMLESQIIFNTIILLYRSTSVQEILSRVWRKSKNISFILPFWLVNFVWCGFKLFKYWK